MSEAPTSSRPRLRVDDAFGYACRRCGGCCVGKRVQVNPYEIARLARSLGTSTGDVRARCVTADSALRQLGDGRCVFLGEGGCRVYADRPLVCRIFPLARRVDEDGTETYRPADPRHVGGAFDDAATVRDFLAAQGAAPYLAAADAYFAWYRRACERLEDTGRHDTHDADASTDVDWLDLDRQVATWCARRGEAEPVDVEARLQLHLRILEGHLEENRDD